MKHSFIDKYSYLNSPIHKIKTEVKILFFFLFSLLIYLIPLKNFYIFHIFSFIILYTLIMISRIPLTFILKRSLTLLPFILIVSVSMAFAKEASIYSLLNSTLKSIGIVSYLIFLMQTVKFNNFLISLKNLNFPNILISLLSFIYRFFFLLTEEKDKIKLAIKSRTGRELNLNLFSKILSVLILKTYEKSQRVTKAMVLRGWDGFDRN